MDENSANASLGFWDRNKLYEKVWCEPVTKVAQRYGVSDVAIAKVCRKLQIPLPGRGYWAKKEHGHSVDRTPLPDLKDPPRLMKPSPSKKAKFPERPEDQAEFERIDRLLTEGAFSLAFDKKMLDHPLVRAAGKALQNGTEDVRHILSPLSGQPCLDIRVSRKTLDRALRIAAQLIATFEAHQYKITVKSGVRDNTSVLCDGDEVLFTIREKVKQLESDPNTSGRHGSVLSYKQVDYEPTGQLSIDIPEYVDLLKKKWSDTDHAQLEEVVPQSVGGVLKVGVALRRRRLDRQERDLESKKRQMELAELAQRIKDEKNRLEQLEQMVANWCFAKDIREFIAEMEAKNAASISDSEPQSKFVEWIRWARDQADRLDPLTPSPPSVLDQEHKIPYAEYSSNIHSTSEEFISAERDRQERTRYFWMGWSKAKRNF